MLLIQLLFILVNCQIGKTADHKWYMNQLKLFKEIKLNVIHIFFVQVAVAC